LSRPETPGATPSPRRLTQRIQPRSSLALVTFIGGDIIERTRGEACESGTVTEVSSLCLSPWKMRAAGRKGEEVM
jgi:hypothetical protein